MSSSTSKTPARRRNRTFTGCLTCRRRKVKCTGGPLPCGNCRRLELECVSPFTKNLRPVTQYFKAKPSANDDAKEGTATFAVNNKMLPHRHQHGGGCMAASEYEQLHIQVPDSLNCQGFAWFDSQNDPLSAVSDESFFPDPQQFVMAPGAGGGVMAGGTMVENGMHADDLNFDLHQQNFFPDQAPGAYYSDSQGYSPHATSPSNSHETLMSFPEYSAWLPEAAGQGQFQNLAFSEQNAQPLQWM